MGSVNKVFLLGVLGADPEARQSKGGKSYVRVSLATHKRVTGESGERRTETQWHKVTIWGKNAEIVSTHCLKGSPLMIEGHLSPFRSELDGRMTSHVAIVAENIQLIPGARSNRSTAEATEFLEQAPSILEGSADTGDLDPLSLQ